MRRYPSPSASSCASGPGPLSRAIKALLAANVVMFVVDYFFPSLTSPLALVPELVTERLWIWQPATYMFLHGSVGHLVVHMVPLWMFGTELERGWGTRYFLKFYFVTGIGAGLLTVLISWLP